MPKLRLKQLAEDGATASAVLEFDGTNWAASAAGPFKKPCRVATTANIATLAGGAPDTVDGVGVAVGNRILVKEQTTGSQNGIYEVDTVGTGSDGSWSRTSDADSSAEVISGMLVRVTEGSTLGDTGWILTTNDPITLDTTSLTFAQDTASDATAIHDDTAGEIAAITAKATPVAADFLLIEDSAAANAKKSITMGDIDHDALTNFVANEHIDWTAASAGTIHTDNYIEGGPGTDTTAIHDNVAGEIAAVAEKVSPVGADLILIEDSAAANAKKRVQISNLPGGGGGDNISVNSTAASDANFSNSTPAAPAGEVNVKWQKDTTAPDNISASVQASSLTQKGVIELATQAEVDAGSDAERAVTPSTLAGTTVAGIDSTAIHDDTSGEISAVTEKTDPVEADLLLIEDSEAANAKKRVQLGNLRRRSSWDPVEVATTANISLTGEQTIDGVLTSTSRVLVKDQSTASENGIYVTAAGAWSRSGDADDNEDVIGGKIVAVSEGTANGNKLFILTTDDPITVGTTGLSFSWIDQDALHDNVAGEIAALTAKATPVAADFLLIEDSAAANAKKSITMGDIDHDALTNFVANEHIDWTAASAGTIHTDNYIEGGPGTDTTAIHDNIAGEIAAVTEKVSPVGADLLLIEDSAAANAKKRVQISNLPGGGGGDNVSVNSTAASDANFSDSTPAAPAGEVNVKWQKDTTAPDNISASVQASSLTQKGVIELATQAEVDAGSDTERAVTPSTLAGTTVAGIDSTAIHDDTAGEISAVTEKTDPVEADLLLIEDSEAANAKKRVQLGNLRRRSSWDPVEVATTSNITLSGEQTIDGVLTSTSRILVKDQSTASENGIYVTAAGAWSRSGDADDNEDVIGGKLVAVSEGTANGNKLFILTADDPITVGSTSLTFSWIDQDAIHDNIAGEIAAITAKATPVAADFLLIEDSAASNAKKSITMGDIDHDALTNFVANEHIDWTAASAGTIHTDNYIEGGPGTDTTAIHDDTAGEISLVTEKASPVSADLILIEDSAAANAKKRVQLGNLPLTATAVSSAAVIADNTLVRGDGGSRGVQDAGITINDTDQMSAIETATFNAEHDNGSQAGPSWTLNWNNGQKQRVTLTGNTTSLTITAPPGPGNFILKIIQDTTGSRTITWPSSVLWPGGTAPTLSGANATDVVSMYYDGTNYYSQAGLNFS